MLQISIWNFFFNKTRKSDNKLLHNSKFPSHILCPTERWVGSAVYNTSEIICNYESVSIIYSRESHVNILLYTQFTELDLFYKKNLIWSNNRSVLI